jgi:hypothetical protein
LGWCRWWVTAPFGHRSSLAFSVGIEAGVVDSRSGPNASIVAFYVVALLAAYLLILPALHQ